MAKGFLLMIAAAMLIPLGDAVAKFAHEAYAIPITFMAWSRFALGAVLLAPFALRSGVQTRDLLKWPVILRGCTIAATVWFILQGVVREPIANIYGAFFIAPVLSFVMAVIWLRERPGPARILLVLLGFCGVVLVVKPNVGLSSGMIFALAAGVCYALYLTANRWLAGRHKAMAMLWAQLIVGGIAMAPFGTALEGAVLATGAWIAIFLSAATSAGANLMIVLAYREVQATRLAPLIYVQLIAATLYGAMFFGTFPDLWSLVGLALLILSGFAALALKRN